MYSYICVGLHVNLTVCFNHSISNLIFDLSFFVHCLFCLAVRAPDQEPPPQHHFPVVGSFDAFRCCHLLLDLNYLESLIGFGTSVDLSSVIPVIANHLHDLVIILHAILVELEFALNVQ